MIIMRITSGLGNQMFQYAFYTLLKEKYKDTEILADTTWFHTNHENRKYELETIFNGVEGSYFNIKHARLSDIIGLSGKLPNLFDGGFGKFFEKFRRYPNRILKDTTLKKRKPFIIDQFENASFDKLMNLDISNDWYISGFFIEEEFYSEILDEIKNHFIFPKFNENSNIKYADEIKSCDSVSIHVRRGDYLSDLYKDKFLTLGRDYYEQAVNTVSQMICDNCNKEERNPNIRFFIFSDDEEFVNREFDWIENKTVITGNTGSNSFRDMQLMSLCKNNIIANSTFSQWGALLNSNEGHITVYPSKYMKDADNEVKKDPMWIRI